MNDIAEQITEDPITTFAALKHICGDHLGTFSNGAPAAWLRGKDLPSQLSVDGCLLLLNEDFAESDRAELLGNQISFRGVYTVEIIQYGETPEIQSHRRSLKHLLTHSLPDTHWRPANSIRGQHRRAMCYIGFRWMANKCIQTHVST